MAVVRSGVPRSPRTAARFVHPACRARLSRVRFRVPASALYGWYSKLSDMEYVATSKTSDPIILSSKFGQSERSARELRGTLDENLRREEHCEHADKCDDEHLQQLRRQPGE